MVSCTVVQEMRADMAEQFVQRPWYTSGSTLQVSRLTAPRAVLLGDAAHAVSAAFGQGVNSALEVFALPAPSGVGGRYAACAHGARQHQRLRACGREVLHAAVGNMPEAFCCRAVLRRGMLKRGVQTAEKHCWSAVRGSMHASVLSAVGTQ